MPFSFEERSWLRTGVLVLSVLGVLCVQSALTSAQMQMPDPKQMSGIPRPVTDLPDRGGIRLMLVATDKSAAAASKPTAAPVAGQVVLSGQSRIIIEPGDEAVQLFYLLDIVNNASAPVNPSTPFAFVMPSGAVGTSL